MFKNSVLRTNVNTKKWLKASAIRAVKTMAQTFVATIGANTLIGAVDWRIVLSSTILAGIVSMANSVAGIPEVEAE